MSNPIYETKKNTGILLNANESYRNLDQELLQKCKDALDSIQFQRYPQDDATQLRIAYAAYANVQPENIMCGNGSDELLGFLISFYLKRGGKLYTFDPDFSMYDYYTLMANGEMVKFPYSPDQVFDVQAFINYGQRENIDMILFSNPNNPTGQTISCEEVLQILHAFPNQMVVVDEAYVDFSDETMVPYLDTFDNLILLRTMSKAFGMASIRCGFLLANTTIMKRIMPYKVPYNVNSISQVIGAILLQEIDRTKAFIQEIIQARDDFYSEVQALQIKDFILYPSKANYLYGTSTKKSLLMDALEEKDIHIRDYQNSDSFRITIGSPSENRMVLDTIKDVFIKELQI